MVYGLFALSFRDNTCMHQHWLYSQMHRFQTLYLKQFSLLLRDKNFDTPKGTSGFPMQKTFCVGKNYLRHTKKRWPKEPVHWVSVPTKKNKQGNGFCLSWKMKFIRLIKSPSVLLDTFQRRFLTRTAVVHLP